MRAHCFTISGNCFPGSGHCFSPSALRFARSGACFTVRGKPIHPAPRMLGHARAVRRW